MEPLRALLDRLEHPVVQAGMGGGLSGGRLAGAVSAAGGLGTVGIAHPPRFEEELRLARELAPGRPIAANLLVPFARPAHAQLAARHADVVVLFAGFDAQLTAAAHDAGRPVLVQVGSVAEAEQAIGDGADGLVVQGDEAGGHCESRTPVLDLLRDVERVAGGRPLLAAGGVAERADVVRLLDAGAAAAVAGTRFLLTPESGAHPRYKERVTGAGDTLRTTLFAMGWPMAHRVAPNAATRRWADAHGDPPRAIGALNRASAPIGGKLPLTAMAVFARVQRQGIPLLSPGPALEGMPDEAVEVTPLYAGTSAARMPTILPAAEAVAALAP